MESCFSIFYTYMIISLLRKFQKEPPAVGFPACLSTGQGGVESGWRALHWRSVSRQPCTVEQPHAPETMASTGRDPLKEGLQKESVGALFLKITDYSKNELL